MRGAPKIVTVRRNGSTTVSITFDERIDGPADVKWRAAMALSRDAAADAAAVETDTRTLEQRLAREVA